MRLITHNSFVCPKPKCRGFPMAVNAVEVLQENKTFDQNFIIDFLLLLDYPALKTACPQFGINDLPENLPPIEEIPENQRENFCKCLHKVLLETRLQEGELCCPKCSAKFAVSSGIVSCLVKESEFLDSGSEDEDESEESEDNEDVEMN